MSTELKTREEFLPLSRPTIGEEEIQEVTAVLRSGWITTGPKVELFEEKFKDYLGISDAVAVSSGTAGLHLALLAAGVGPGDEVITSTMTFVATANAIVFCGARPVFVDCDPQTLNLDIEEVRRRISPKTRAVIPVHFAGQPCPMTELSEIATQYGLFLIEDAAHALGREYRGQKIGTVADATVFSFHPIKAITTGEGGMVVTRNRQWAERMRHLRFHGIQSTAWQRHGGGRSPHYSINFPGFKYTMMDLQAAIGIHQMDRLETFVSRRTFLSELYNCEFRDIGAVQPLGRVSYPHRHSWHLYVVRLDTDGSSTDRDSLLEYLRARRIGAGIHFPVLHLQPYYQERWGFKRGDFPNAERVSERILSLPLFPAMREKDVGDVVRAVSEMFEESRK
jgi:dTDP-4-amino-4,6-dideoxygalactose transaminase